jgi:hypothetical protein
MVRGDGLVIGWLGHPVFRLADNTQVLFVDATGVVRADQVGALRPHVNLTGVWVECTLSCSNGSHEFYLCG